MNVRHFIKSRLPRPVVAAIASINRPFHGKWSSPADKKSLGKAKNRIERFREIVSDPLNLLVERVPEAGYINKNMEVTLHNGIIVPITGRLAYCGGFADILALNRGVHEPLEEYCFQELIRLSPKTGKEQIMIELGAYWGHYSMWFKKFVKNSRCILVEPNTRNLQAGKHNFSRNNLDAEFIKAFVSEQDFTIDGYIASKAIKNIHLLHADIQGYELDMLKKSQIALSKNKINYLMISTHGSEIHSKCLEEISRHQYDIEVTSEPNYHSTSHDGFIFARKYGCRPIIGHERTLGRTEIAKSSCEKLLHYLNEVHNKRPIN
jgi:hypothetical protein